MKSVLVPFLVLQATGVFSGTEAFSENDVDASANVFQILARHDTFKNLGRANLGNFLPATLQIENLTLDTKSYWYQLLNNLLEVVAFIVFQIINQILF